MNSQISESRFESTDIRQHTRLPDFLIIGAAKSATTTLYEYLTRQQAIFMSPEKEPCYFSHDDVYAKGEDWYRSLFAGARDDQICGEASTTYSRWPQYPHAAERIARAIPQARFIYVMRHPVERIYSFYGHRMRLQVTMTLEQFLTAVPEAIDSSF